MEHYLHQEREQYTEIFKERLKQYPDFEEWLGLAQRYSEGEICVLGGFVYRNIVNGLYGHPMPEVVDIDFLAELPAKKTEMFPDDWEMESTYFGDIRLKKGNVQIDIMNKKNFRYPVSILNETEAPIRHFWFNSTPMNIQSITYCPRTGEVVGNRSIKSIKDRLITVNDPVMAALASQKYGTVGEMLRSKAESLNFDYWFAEKRRDNKKEPASLFLKGHPMKKGFERLEASLIP